MAYNVNKYDGSTLTLIADRTLDTSSTIKLLGRNYPGYGEIMAENMVQMMENFARITPPDNPLAGQVWFDKNTNVLKVYDGYDWSYAGGAGNLNATSIDATPIVDTLGRKHEAIKFRVGGTVILIISKDPIYYNPVPTLDFAANFPRIGPGVNLNMAAGGPDEVEKEDAGTLYKVRARAVEAEFADLAEMYQADAAMSPGDIVKLGGANEITLNDVEMGTDVFGVISTNPAFLLNSAEKAKDLNYAVALTGRVPVKVVGKVKKGQRIVASNIPGVARAVDAQEIKFVLQIIGRALESKDTDEVGLVEIVVGAR